MDFTCIPVSDGPIIWKNIFGWPTLTMMIIAHWVRFLWLWRSVCILSNVHCISSSISRTCPIFEYMLHAHWTTRYVSYPANRYVQSDGMVLTRKTQICTNYDLEKVHWKSKIWKIPVKRNKNNLGIASFVLVRKNTSHGLLIHVICNLYTFFRVGVNCTRHVHPQLAQGWKMDTVFLYDHTRVTPR